MRFRSLSILDLILLILFILQNNLSVSQTPVATPTPQQHVLPVTAPPSGYYLVTKVVDGDTLTVSTGLMHDKVRLIGIDTPEVVDPRKPVQCFGKEASNKMKALVGGRSVVLASDPTQADKDKYGRKLRYVYLPNGVLVNKVMIEEGYAYEYTYDTPYQYQVEFRSVEQSARTRGLGLWKEGVCPVQ